MVRLKSVQSKEITSNQYHVIKFFRNNVTYRLQEYRSGQTGYL